MAFRQWADRANRAAAPGRRRLDAASLLGIGGPCLDDWTRRWRTGRRGAKARGRPSAQASRETLAQVYDILENSLGPATSVATLTGLCPELGRNEAAKCLREYRRQCRIDYHATVNALQWLQPGAVWAMDHTRPPGAVDGLYPQILLVRDLASHFQVAAMPQEAATDHAVADALADLFGRYGAPLVIKFDNHGAFTGRATQQMLEKWGVLPLVSPPYRPEFNGSVESGGGHFKTRAHILAARMNHPGHWTSNIVEGARLHANRLLYPWERNGPTPEERFDKRRLFAPWERRALRRAFEARLAEYKRQIPDNPNEINGGILFRVERRDRAAPAAPWAARLNARPENRPDLPARTAAARASGLPADAGKTSREDGNEDRKDANPAGIFAGQAGENTVYCQCLKRRSLTDALVAAGLLIIRKRVIPLPIKRLIRLKIS